MAKVTMNVEMEMDPRFGGGRGKSKYGVVTVGRGWHGGAWLLGLSPCAPYEMFPQTDKYILSFMIR